MGGLRHVGAHGPKRVAAAKELVDHVDSPEESNESIYADAARAASGEKSFGENPAQAMPTPQTMQAAMHAVQIHIEYAEPLLQGTLALDQREHQ